MISRQLASSRARRPAVTSALGPFALALAVLAPVSAPAATIPPRINLSSADLSKPIVLDQSGRWFNYPKASPGVGTSDATSLKPTYIGYRIGRDGAVPADYPTIDAGPRVPGQTVGPLHLTPATQAQLNAALAQNGEAVMTSGSGQALVRPVSGNPTAPATVSAWLAGQATAGTGTTGSTAAAQQLDLSSISKPITDSSVLKDIGRLLTFKSGKFGNWNQQNLDKLKRDLGLGSPKNVATHPAVAAGAGAKGTVKSPAGQVAAQELSVNVLATPVPEPGTYLIFGLGAGALLLRRRLGLARRG